MTGADQETDVSSLVVHKGQTVCEQANRLDGGAGLALLFNHGDLSVPNQK
jgi:hypothetical protein